MAILFVTNPKVHPEDVKPNIIVPYAEINGTKDVLNAVKLGLGIQGLRPRMVRMERDFSYDQLFRELWDKSDPFILVEHDIVPWPGAVQQLWKCPEPWCGFPYYVFGELRSYLGCTKFEPKRLGECPLPEELQQWQVIDKKIERELVKRGFRGHIHSPAVSHLNFAHVRQTESILEHPNFWDEGEEIPECCKAYI